MTMNLYDYFGVIGLLSILGWVAALALLAAGARHCRRHHAWLLALGIAVVAVGLARLNSSRVSAIQVDRSAEIEEARQRAAAARLDTAGSLGAQLQFAEDAPGEAARVAIDPGRDDEDAPADGAPWYKQPGKQQRDPDRRDADAAPIVAAATDADAPRAMTEPDVLRANHYDRLNLLAVRLTFLLALGLVAGDYLRRLNRTFEDYHPLPIGGPWLDQLFPKTRSVLLSGPATARVAGLLRTAVRRGEPFLYFGTADPFPEPALPRLTLKGRPLWALPKLRYGDPELPADPEFFLDAAWYNRYAVVVVGADAAAAVLRELVRYLDMRCHTGAAARRTVQVAWDLPDPPPDVERLVADCSATNCKLILTTATPPPPALAAAFEES